MTRAAPPEEPTRAEVERMARELFNTAHRLDISPTDWLRWVPRTRRTWLRAALRALAAAGSEGR